MPILIVNQRWFTQMAVNAPRTMNIVLPDIIIYRPYTPPNPRLTNRKLHQNLGNVNRSAPGSYMYLFYIGFMMVYGLITNCALVVFNKIYERDVSRKEWRIPYQGIHSNFCRKVFKTTSSWVDTHVIFLNLKKKTKNQQKKPQN